MKSKKGFTLIELLAVIVILAIIALIATPIVLNIIENAKKDSYANSTNGYVDAVKLAYVTATANGTTIAATASLSTISITGDKATSGSYTVDTSGNVSVYAVYSNGYKCTANNLGSKASCSK